jgi:DNA-directed RNA polymerase subunit RPC12/RpoP
MFENARQLLAHGIATLKSQPSGDQAASRTYFKRVLSNPDATSEQKAIAWLWLSQLENDVADRQFCLEQALELDPNNVLAQRGLVMLTRRLQSQKAGQPHASDIWRSACPQCGGVMEFEVTHNQLTCQYCGYHHAPQPTLHHVAGEQDFLAALPTRQAQNWHLAVAQTLKCAGCGATFTLPKLEISGECPFCGSLHVVETTAEADLIEPDGILTFQIDEIEARHAVKAWLAQNYPAEHNIRLSRLRAVYLPYWTFDLGGEIILNSHYHPLYDWQQRLIVGGEWACDHYPVCHDDLLVPATRTIPGELLDQANDFSTAVLQPYSSEILAAWSAEVYQISLAAASLIARQHAVNTVLQKSAHAFWMPIAQALQLPYAARIDSTPLLVQSYKLVLLPVWLGRYRLQDQMYRLVVNGQTGKTAGEMPPPPNNWRHQLGRLLGTE